MIDNLAPITLMPHGYCLSWQPGLIAALVIGNALTAIAYFTIPLVILRFIRQRNDIDFQRLHWLFAGFIVTCGITHLLHVIELWYPVYYLEAIMDMATAAVSIIAAILLWKLLPVFVHLPSSHQLQSANNELKKTGAALTERELQLRNLGDSLPDSFLYQLTVEDEKFKFLHVSSGIERLNGIKVEIALQDAMMFIGQINPEQRDAYTAALAVSQNDMSDFSMELRMLRTDGEWRWLQLKSRPRRASDGKILWEGIATDITDRHLLESEINRLAQAVEQNPTGVLIISPEGEVQFTNRAFTRITGYDFGYVYAKRMTPREIISDEITETEYGIILAQVHTGKPWVGVLRNHHKSGKLFWEQLTVSPVFDREGKLGSYLYLYSDVTEQINSEADLKLRSKALERANADLTRFADVSAHHLMEPTRRLTSYAQQLKARVTDMQELSKDEEVLLSLHYIEQDAARLRTLVRDVQLYLAAATPRGEVALQDTCAILSTIQQRLSQKLSSQHISLDVGFLPVAMLDRPRLTDLFALLLDNAMIHGQSTNPDTDSVIRIYGEREGSLSRFHMCDNGCGVPAEYLERVFEIFERLNVKGGGGGTGIGLSIARRIVESQHGRIWIESLAEGGAMVVFELPDGE